MPQRPTLQTDRLILRPFTLEDAPEVQRLAGDRAVAASLGDMPHPYEDGVAEEWISAHPQLFDEGKAAQFAIIRRDDNELLGTVSLTIAAQASQAELGYWLGVPYWGNGYCTEAAAEVLRYGFEALELNRIHACHFGSNPASGRVMQKLGMTYEGCRRDHFCKWGVFHDSVDYAILRAEYEAQSDTD